VTAAVDMAKLFFILIFVVEQYKKRLQLYSSGASLK
jgi:hypothetical protein